MIEEMYKHFLTWNREFGIIQANVEMLMKMFWIVMVASITAVIGAVYNTILLRRHNDTKPIRK